MANTTDWPVVSAVMTPHCAAPWISGGSIMILMPGLAAARSAIVVVGLDDARRCTRFRPPKDVTKMSCWRHSTPLGMPVVPPV